MLSARRLKFLSFALVMSGGTAVLTQQWLQGAVQQARAEASSRVVSRPPAPASDRRVLVAKQAVPAGTILKAEHLAWQAWPAEASTDGYFTEATTQLDKMAGAVARTHIDAGEPLSPGRVVQPGERGFMAAVLQPGFRAVTVPVNASSGVAGYVMPGDRIDLILSRKIPGEDSRQDRFVSETVLTDVRVLGMDQRAAEAEKDVVVASTATLEVTPKGAEIIAVSGQLGALSLSLRSLAESYQPVATERQVTRTSDAEATGVARPAAARSAAARTIRAAAPARAPQVVVYRGAGSTP